MASSPELFVVCKNCRSQVSPYITECPYCGQRLRKRAPKIERGGDGQPGKPKTPRRARSAKPRKPALSPLRSGEIPGIRGDALGKPKATIALVALGALFWLAAIPLEDERSPIAVNPLAEWWQILTAPFLQTNGWYQFAALGALGLFGWMLERRNGPLTVVVVWLLSASGGMALAKLAGDGVPLGNGETFAVGASGGALGLLCAWAVPILLARRRRGDSDDDADMIAAGVIFVLLSLMPVAQDIISPVATVTGIVVGGLCGVVLQRLDPRD